LTLLTLRDVTKTYKLGPTQQVTALRSVSLDVDQGQFVVITGRSGSGKTTLLNVAAGLTTPTNGHVLIGGVDLTALSVRERASLRTASVGFVFQFPSLLPSLTVLENVLLPVAFGHGRPGSTNRAMELLGLVGLPEKAGALPRQLSAGQQQRVVVARALLNEPPLVLADEPTSNLDERTEIEVMQLFARIHTHTGVTVVMVTHSSQLVAYGTRAVEMAEGEIVGERAVTAAVSGEGLAAS
jgi:putative ABC transport system ATP-binding protein